MRVALGERVQFSSGRLLVSVSLGFSSYLQPKILSKILQNTDFTVSHVYPSLHTAAPGGDGANEQGATSGNRPAALDETGTWDTANATFTDGKWVCEYTVNSSTVSWVLMPAGTYNFLGLWDSQANGSGNFLWGGVNELTEPFVIAFEQGIGLAEGDKILAKIG
jgi:hypothetical protein